MDLRSAAKAYLTERGWATTPLRSDQSGKPKIPITTNWQRGHAAFGPDPIMALDWQSAAGIGIILGEASGGVEVLDVDNAALGTRISEVYASKTRCVRTISGNLHVYVQPAVPTPSTRFEVQWGGQPRVGIELKGAGTQVAAPPTVGRSGGRYEVIGVDNVLAVPALRTFWSEVATHLGLALQNQPRGAGYPKPWADWVPPENRNRAAYIEAHYLREGLVPLSYALKFLRWRWEESYDTTGFPWDEMERTVESAYEKTHIKIKGWSE